MLFCAIHLDDAPRRVGAEEVHVVVPDGSKTAIAVPLDALPKFLALLDRALGDRSNPECSACGGAIPASIPRSRCSPGA